MTKLGTSYDDKELLGITPHTRRGILTILGGSLWMTYLGSQFICSNLSPYLQAYYGVQTPDTQILLPIISFVSMPSIILGTFLAKNKFDPRLQILIGGVLGIGGCFLSSLTDNFWIFLILFAIPFGIANGLTYAVAMNVAWSYFPNREGMVSGIISACFSLGAFIFGLLSIE